MGPLIRSHILPRRGLSFVAIRHIFLLSSTGTTHLKEQTASASLINFQMQIHALTLEKRAQKCHDKTICFPLIEFNIFTTFTKYKGVLFINFFHTSYTTVLLTQQGSINSSL